MSLAAPFRDRRVRLALFGWLASIVGVLTVLLGLLHLALPLLGRALPDLEFDAALIFTGLTTYVAIGTVLILTGIGSIRRKRWTRAAMLTIGWTWLLVGAGVVGFVATRLDDLTILAGGGLASRPPEVDRLIHLVMLAPTIAFGLFVPATILWVYRDLDILATCRAHHPEPDWSDRCPSGVLILSLALAFTGVLSIPLAVRPTLPWFGRLLGGPAGAAGMLWIGVLSCWIAWRLFQLRPVGWWATGAFSVVLGVSTTLTLIHTPRAEWYRALGYPEKQIEQLTAGGDNLPWIAIGATVAFTLLTWAYLLVIRPHFRRG